MWIEDLKGLSAVNVLGQIDQRGATKWRSCAVDHRQSQRHTFRRRSPTSRNPLNQSRKSYEPTPYAALRGEEPAAGAMVPQVDSPSVPAVPNNGNQEVKRLSELRHALWGAFEAGGPLPMPLIEFTHAYTAALRLELSLKVPPRPAIAGSLRAGLPIGRRE